MSPRGIVRAAARVAIALLVLPAWPASANHAPGGTYSGTVAGGGTITFVVSGDGSQIDSMTVENVEGSTCTFVSASTSGIPIVDHAFNRDTGTVRATGTFPSPGNAQGTVRLYTTAPFVCDTGVLNWTATGPALSPKDVTLKVKPKKVEKGEKTRLTAKVSPCGGHEGDTVDIYRGSKKIATKASNASCVAKFKVKMKKTAKFQAVSPQQDADHLEGASNKVKVKVVV